MKRFFSVIILTCLLNASTHSQVLYRETFGALTLSTAPSNTAAQSSFTDVPSNYKLINDGFKNNVGTSLNYNKPFNNALYKTTGWVCLFNALENDTFLVSTSWLDSVATCNRWVITPPITITNDTTVLTWNAKSPDATFADGYEVFYTTSTASVLTTNDFIPANALFAIADNNVSGGGESTTWIKRAVSLTGKVGQTLRFGFRNNSRDRFQLWIDDIEVVKLQRALDGALTQNAFERYVLAGSSQTLGITVSALGSLPINTVSVSYKIGNGLPQTEILTLTSPLTYGQTRNITFSIPYTINTAGLYTFKTWINQLNGLNDENKNNDTLSGTISVQSVIPAKTCLVEQFTSVTNGACSQAQSDLLALANSSVIVVNVHDADSMQSANGSALATAYRKNYATLMLDRHYWKNETTVALTKSQLGSKIVERLNSVSPASVSIINKNYNPVTRQLIFTVKADFVAEVKGDFRLNAMLVENNVYGPILDTALNGYNQYNDFYFTPWSAYYQQGYFSPLANTHVLSPYTFKHQRVLNQLIDGAFGLAGTIPTNGGTLNQSYSKTYTITLPNSIANAYKWNPDNIYLVATINEFDLDKNKRSVLNAVQEKMTVGNEVISVKETTVDAIQWQCWPNPANQFVTVQTDNAFKNMEVSITDVTGRVVLQEKMQVARLSLDVNHLKNGVYMIRMKQENGTSCRKLVISR
jgi:hypothetical protein